MIVIEKSDYQRSSDDVDSLIASTRLELHQLREKQSNHQQPRRDAELQHYRHCLSRSQRALTMKLSTSRPQSTHPYVAILRFPPAGREKEEKKVSPAYVLNLEALLLQAMHLSFLVHPAQEELTTRLTQNYLCEYLEDQKKNMLAENQQFDQRVIQQISHVAEENIRLYLFEKAAV